MKVGANSLITVLKKYRVRALD